MIQSDMQIFKNIRFLFFCAAILLVGNISVYQDIFAPRALEMTILETGKNNAVLVRAPYGKIILIDTGPDAGILRALGAALPMWRRNIDAVILTGAKDSFVGGLPEIENRYDVSKTVRVGDSTTPYGTSLTFDDLSVKIASPGTISISYKSVSFNVSSSTPTGFYVSDGKTVAKIK